MDCWSPGNKKEFLLKLQQVAKKLYELISVLLKTLDKIKSGRKLHVQFRFNRNQLLELCHYSTPWVLSYFPFSSSMVPSPPYSCPPQITIRPKNLQVKAGGIAVFYCAATGDPQPVIHWRKNGKKVSRTQTRHSIKTFPQQIRSLNLFIDKAVGKLRHLRIADNPSSR
ncbi:hypothetical protein RUM44_002874 [Polyplax serrata]|uniref:Ig-like domain-containing protein n=1 Tax=Polyplax serrata TaxID=468196 RepID=A0ABR1AWX2_POLSC